MFNGNMKKIMKQAKQMQDKMMETQKELESMEVEGSSGGGAVKAVINGKKELISLDIDSELLSDDKEILEDLIIACVNQAQNKFDEISKDKMGAISGGLPGGFARILMESIPKTLESIISDLCKLPSIGRRTAERLAIFLLESDSIYLKSFSKHLNDLDEKISECEICHCFIDLDSTSDENQCLICSDQRRNKKYCVY